MIRDGDPISKLLDGHRLEQSRGRADPIKALLEGLEGHAAGRTNWKNDGRAFQKSIALTGLGYDQAMIATLAKVDPPNFIVGTGQLRRVIFKANPFLDFIGVWTSRHGRMLMVEAKSTATHRLPLNRSGGITTEQLATIYRWRYAGAAVAVLWIWNDRVVLFTPEMLRAANTRGDKSLVHEDGIPVPRGTGRIVWDFLPALAAAIWPPKTDQEPCQCKKAIDGPTS